MNALDVGMVNAVRNALAELDTIEKAAIERARLILELQGHSVENFKNENGFTVRLMWHSFVDTKLSTDLTFVARDAQSNGPEKVYRVSREMLFGDTEELRDFNELKRLQGKLKR